MIDLFDLQKDLRRICKDEALTMTQGPIREHSVEISLGSLVPIVEWLMQGELLHHLSAITAYRQDGSVQLLYHLWISPRNGSGLTLRVDLSRESEPPPTLAYLLPNADWFEREIGELYGVRFAGHPDPRHLLLGEGRDEICASMSEVDA